MEMSSPSVALAGEVNGGLGQDDAGGEMGRAGSGASWSLLWKSTEHGMGMPQQKDKKYQV